MTESADIMVEGKCDTCGVVDVAGLKAAIATQFDCGWCHQGRFILSDDDADIDPLCLGCHVDAQLDTDGYCSDCNDEIDDL